jgi:CheY-like chemotaxis protein
MARMLVVDDDPAWRALYRMAFEGQFEIFEAADGQHGLTLVDAVRPDVILLDLRMPRVDGLDFIRRLDHRGGRPPVVVCSGVLGDGEKPPIPGVPVTLKSPDLKDLWTALRTAVPAAAAFTAPIKPHPVSDDPFWRD